MCCLSCEILHNKHVNEKRPFSQLFGEIWHFSQKVTTFKLMVDNTEESYHIEFFFIGSGRHAAFRKYVNGDNMLTQLFFTRMGNLVKMGKSAGGGGLPF